MDTKQREGKVSEPYRCPVCYGKGVVPQGFYSTGQYPVSTNAGDLTCRACGGQGVIWGKQEPSQ